jgi:hypothetical protein
MTIETDFGTGQHFNAHQDERQFRWVYAVIFTITLVSTLFARLMPRRLGERGGLAHKSIIDDARARTSRIVPFFFMG